MNNLNNFNNCEEIDQINTQLERAEIQKNKLICDIYREYEHYLNLLRDLLSPSIKKGLNELCSYSLIKDNFLSADELFSLFENKIITLIKRKLPFITVEQLKINKFKNKINKENDLDGLGMTLKKIDDQKEKIQYEDSFQYEESIQFQISEDISNTSESIQFQISEDISNTSEYYQAVNDEKFVSLDLDKNDNINYLSHNNIIENIGVEKQFISSLLELIEEVKPENPQHSQNQNINQMYISSTNKSVKNFDLIDKSLENLLLNLSYKINLELFKANLIKKMISKDSFKYLVGKNLMIKHPHPFVINFEFKINQSSLNLEKLPSITFFNISTVELEFKSLNLSIQRNKINELKNKLQRLIKKEKYWKQKEITLNKIR